MSMEYKTQYNKISDEWDKMVLMDPVKALLQYPSVMRVLEDLNGKKILDIGTGNGAFARLMAEKGAKVVGYDSSSSLIETSEKKQENTPGLGKKIDYHVADQTTFSSEESFDKAVAINVLNYAEDIDALKSFFESAYKHLTDNGQFVALVFNPDFKSYDELILNRRIVKTNEDSNKMIVCFVNPETKTETSAEFYFYKKEDFEKVASEVGFTDFNWTDVIPDARLREVEEGKVSDELEKHKMYALFVAQK